MGKQNTIRNKRRTGMSYAINVPTLTLEDEINRATHKKETRKKTGGTDKRYTPGIEMDKEARNNWHHQDLGHKPGAREAIRSFSRTK